MDFCCKKSEKEHNNLELEKIYSKLSPKENVHLQKYQSHISNQAFNLGLGIGVLGITAIFFEVAFLMVI